MSSAIETPSVNLSPETEAAAEVSGLDAVAQHEQSWVDTSDGRRRALAETFRTMTRLFERND